MTYDGANRLLTETRTMAGGSARQILEYIYDAASNLIEKVGHLGTYDSNEEDYVYPTWDNGLSYDYNSLNQLTRMEGNWRTGFPGALTLKEVDVSYTYDANGNRITRIEGEATDAYQWDGENRLVSLTKESDDGTGTYGWLYDYRTRRVELGQLGVVTKAVFSGGTSVREYVGGLPTVDYIRGSDWGGGVGGILYTLRGGDPSFTHYNRRGDVTTKTDETGAVTYQATYEAHGKRNQEIGSTDDRQRSNTKDEDIPGYANEGFRFRDLETGVFLSADPAGFVDGPNLYAFVRQNPWTKFDPEGLSSRETKEGVKPAGKVHHKVGGVIMTVSQFAETAQAEGIRQAGGDAIEQTINPIGLSSREMKDVHRQAYQGFWDMLTDGVYDNDMKDRWNTLPEDK